MEGDNTYDWTDYGQDVLNIMLPWITCSIVALLIFIIAILYRTINKLCCKNKIKASNKCVRRTCVVTTIIITLTAIASCGVLIWYLDYVYQGIEQVTCAGGKIPNELLAGSKGENWVGIDKGIQDIENVTKFLDEDFKSDTTNTWAGSG